MLTSDPLWTTRSFVGFYLTNVLHIQSPCELFLGYIMPLVIVSLALVNHALLSSLSYLFLKFVVCVPKMARWVESMSSLNPCELEIYAGYTLVAFCQVKFQCYNFLKCEK